MADPTATDPVTVEKVAQRLGVDPATLTDVQRDRISDAIFDAQTKAEEEIGRGPLVQRSYTLSGQWPVEGFELTDWRAWPQALELDDFVTVVSATPDADWDDRFTVVLLLGIDGASEAPIQRFILADAVASLASDPNAGVGQRAVKSLSAEGQSITWVDAPAATANGPAPVGSAPSITLLRRYKQKVWLQRPNASRVPWPYVGSSPWW